MRYDADEKLIKDALDTIKTPKYNIGLEVEKKMKNKKLSLGHKRPAAAALMICLLFIFSTGVAAATIKSFNNVLALVSPGIASILYPVNVSDEDKGIKMEVVAAMNDDEMAVIYVTMQDLTGNRVDENIDLYNYSLTGTMMLNSQVVHYDEKTQTATLRIVGNGGKSLNNKLAGIYINSFLSDKQIHDEVNTGINLLDIGKTDQLQLIPLDMDNIPGGGGNLYSEYRNQGIVNILKPEQMKISFPGIDFMYISNMGYIEDRLHIQTRWVGDGVDDHGYFYFVDSKGDTVNIDSSRISFGTDETGTTQYGSEYSEYIFAVEDIDLNDVELMGYFVTNGNFTTGKWRTTFRFEPVVEEKRSAANIELNSWTANSVSVSPMGVTLVGSGEGDELDKIKISANLIDGSKHTFDSTRVYRENNMTRAKFTSSSPLDISKLESVSINEHVVKFD
ncbi:DUF4179 domain-containing protein [Dethiobacter alkaliphilus]|uniref:DUF4179 domain-containing protein n=1 Tax=Dethiobacter alkaliphilus AHT 1 TaxID=555088 RepID=C0GD96_DETAL|nr:DUF4179 domain-containing protein [Dethiobacter alkaliphilus]EEG78617.1 conserved hypothetical protein [Dethiobacter alkaliphilus AHT 1]